MRKYLFLSFITLLFFSCSHLGGKTEGIFTTYPRDTFLNTSTDETGLLIEGEN